MDKKEERFNLLEKRIKKLEKELEKCKAQLQYLSGFVKGLEK